MPLDTIIIDDEQFARDDLGHMLKAHSEIRVVGEAGSIAGAKRLLSRVAPDVAFLDIRLQGGSGFDLVSHIPPKCEIIFYTAHDTYAVRAFEVNALDYLLKPVTGERLAAAIQKLHQYIETPRQPLRTLKPLQTDDFIFIRTPDEQRFIEVDRVIAVTAAGGNYTSLFLENDHPPLIWRTMKCWERILPSGLFVRIHRSSIVNFRRIHRLTIPGTGNASVYLHGHTEPLEVSRRALPGLKRRLKNIISI